MSDSCKGTRKESKETGKGSCKSRLVLDSFPSLLSSKLTESRKERKEQKKRERGSKIMIQSEG